MNLKYLPIGENAPRIVNAIVEIEHFFTSYKELEGKHVKSFGRHGSAEVRRAIERAGKTFAGYM